LISSIARFAVRMDTGAESRGADRVVHIDVVEDNPRIETTKLHHGPLQSAAGAFRQHARRLDSTDQIDDSNFGTFEELVRIAPAAPGA